MKDQSNTDVQKHFDMIRSQFYLETKLRLIMEEMRKEELRQYRSSKVKMLGRWALRVFCGGATV
jgi:hypothetical protein